MAVGGGEESKHPGRVGLPHGPTPRSESATSATPVKEDKGGVWRGVKRTKRFLLVPPPPSKLKKLLDPSPPEVGTGRNYEVPP